MNKNMLKICFVIAVTLSASTAYCSAVIDAATVLGTNSFSPSNKVSIGIATTATAYTIKSKHGAGDRMIAANNTDAKMWFKTVAVSTVTEATATNDTLDAANGWS